MKTEMETRSRPVVLLDPTEGPAATTVGPARRLSSLTGARLAIVDNSKYGADLLLAGLAAELERRHGARLSLTIRKPASGRPLTDDDLEQLAQHADAILNGVGD